MGRLQTCVCGVLNTYNRRQISVFPKCGVVGSVVRLRVRVWHRVRVGSYLSLLAALTSLLPSLPFADWVSAMIPTAIQAQFREERQWQVTKCSHALRTSTMLCDFTTLNIIYK